MCCWYKVAFRRSRRRCRFARVPIPRPRLFLCRASHQRYKYIFECECVCNKDSVGRMECFAGGNKKVWCVCVCGRQSGWWGRKRYMPSQGRGGGIGLVYKVWEEQRLCVVCRRMVWDDADEGGDPPRFKISLYRNSYSLRILLSHRSTIPPPLGNV